MIQIRPVPESREYIYSSWELRSENFFDEFDHVADFSSERFSAGQFQTGGSAEKNAAELVCLYGGTSQTL
jgi:hypothetical protein